MGVPKFFRWIRFVHGSHCYFQVKQCSNPMYLASATRPVVWSLLVRRCLNSVHFTAVARTVEILTMLLIIDNLYLDLNGVIHQCSHPSDGSLSVTLSDDKLLTLIFNYIETLFQLIKPKQTFFVAVDGTAISWVPANNA